VEKLIVVKVIQDENPISSLLIIQPIVEQLENMCLGILPTSYLDSICNLPATLLEAS
jgi:hypothetical protein